MAQVPSINRPTAGSVADPAPLLANFDLIITQLNGGLDDSNIKAGAGIQQSKIAGLTTTLANLAGVAGTYSGLTVGEATHAANADHATAADTATTATNATKAAEADKATLATKVGTSEATSWGADGNKPNTLLILDDHGRVPRQSTGGGPLHAKISYFLLGHNSAIPWGNLTSLGWDQSEIDVFPSIKFIATEGNVGYGDDVISEIHCYVDYSGGPGTMKVYAQLTDEGSPLENGTAHVLLIGGLK